MKKATLGAAILTLIMAVVASAQTSVGEISGYVYDEQGAVVPHATITVTSPALMGGRRLNSGEVGQYRIIMLPPGNYTLVVSKENYETQEIQNISVRAGKTSSFNITLKVGDFENTITIIHEAPLIDVKSPQRGLNISGDYFDRVPINYNRQWDSVWSLVPGTITEGQYSSRDYVQVHGATPFQNVFNLDGMRIGSMNENTSNIFFNTDIIEEVSVVTSGMDASVSAGYGGYINLVTKSGGNDFHGSVSFTFQPADWNWSNIPDGIAAEREIYLPDFSIGGPIVKDKTWFFASYRYVYQNEAYAYTANDIARITAVDLEVPDQPLSDRSNQIFGKITQMISDNHKMTATFNYDEGHQDNNSMFGAGSVNTGLKVDTGGKYGNTTLQSIWGKNLNTTLRVSYYRNDSNSVSSNGVNSTTIYRYPTTYMSNGNRYGSGAYSFYNGYYYGFPGTGYQNERLEIRGDANLYLENLVGQHDISVGFAALPIQEYSYDYLYADGPQRADETRNDAGQWVRYYEKQYDVTSFTVASKELKNYAAYIQDAWTVNDRLTASAGVRVENQKDGQLIDVTGVNPNIGFSYAFSKDYSDAVRFSYGLRRYLFSAQDVFSSESGGSAGYTERWDNDLDGTWDAFNVVIGSPNSSFDASSYNLDPNLEPAWSHNWQIGYNRVMPFSTNLDIAYMYTEFRGALTSFNTNIIWDGDTFAGYVDPTVDTVYLRTNNQWNFSYNSSLEVSLIRDFKDNWQFMGSYTMMTNGQKGDWNADWAWAHMHPDDWYETSETRHIVRLAGNFILPYDVTLSTNVLWQTAPAESPYQLSWGTGVEGVDRDYTLSNGRVIRHPFFATSPYYRPLSEREVSMESLTVVNLGLGKDFTLMGHRFQAQVQAFNLFNSASPTAYKSGHNTVDKDGNHLYDSGGSWFGYPQAPRVVQAFIRWVF